MNIDPVGTPVTDIPHLFCICSMFSQSQMQPGWLSPNAEVEQLTNKVPADPRLPRTSPITPFLGMPQMPASPNPLATAHQAAQQVTYQAAHQAAHQYPMTQFYHQSMQTSPLMLGSVFSGRVAQTQTSPIQMQYADTQTSPRPMIPQTPVPAVFGPSPAHSSQRSSRSSCRYSSQSAEDKVCERCGENSWVTREQYFVLRMRRKAARFALKYQSQSTPPQLNPYVHPNCAPCRSGVRSTTSLPRPSPRPAPQPAAVVSPSAWRPWSSDNLDYQNVKARAEAAMTAHRRTLTSHKVTSTSFTKHEPEDRDRKC